MELKVEDVLSYIGIEDVKDFDTFKSKFNEKHISREMAVKDDDIKKAVTGAVYGSLFREAKRKFKDAGVEFEAGEVADNDVKSLLDIGTGKIASKFEELTKAAPDVEKWQQAVEKEKRKANEFSELLTATKSELEKVQTEAVTKVKAVKLDVEKTNLFKSLGIGSTVDQLTLKGFDVTMSEKYKLDIDDDTGSAVILDAATGSRVKHPDRAEFADPLTVYKIEAEKAGLLAKVKNNVLPLQQSQRDRFEPSVNPDGVTRKVIKPANAKR
jgi:hypothetical protein